MAEQTEGKVALGARAVFSRTQRWALFAAFVLIVMFRLPHAWAHGRFQDEEATVFLAYAWHFPWQDALLRSFAGYLNLGASASTVATVQLVRSGILPLERAPYLTMIVALGFQVLPAVLILTGWASWLENRLAVIAALLMIAIMPATEETFFNVLHIQFHLALCAALILALDVPQGRGAKAGYGVILFLAPLCGPAAIVLVPLFAVRGVLDRDRERLMDLVVLAAGAAVQLLFFYGPSPVRAHVVELTSIPAVMFVRLIALPATGIHIANHIATALKDSQLGGGSLVWLLGAVAVGVFAVLTAFAVRRRDAAIWLLLSSLSIATASFGLGMVIVTRVDLFNVIGGERYNFLPLVLLGMTLICLAMRTEFPGRRVFALLCVPMLLSGAYYYQTPLEDFADGPSWPAEVKAWRTDHSHPLAVWPSRWAADLSDESHPCSPLSRVPGQSKDPRYCESGWVAAFFKPRHRTATSP